MSRPEVSLTPERSAVHRFGYELRSWRKARGLSQDGLGRLVHVSADLVRLVEIGRRRPARDFAERCDQALNTLGALVRLWEDTDRERQAQASTVRPEELAELRRRLEWVTAEATALSRTIARLTPAPLTGAGVSG